MLHRDDVWSMLCASADAWSWAQHYSLALMLFVNSSISWLLGYLVATEYKKLTGIVPGLGGGQKVVSVFSLPIFLWGKGTT